MPIENITQRIISDAKKKTAKLKKEAEAEAKKIIQEAEQEVERMTADYRVRAKKQAEEEKKRVLALARLQARDAVVLEKRQAVESVIEDGLKKVLRLPESQYHAFIKKMLLEAIETGEEEVILSEEDRKKFGEKLILEINAELSKSGKKGKIRLSSETREIQGGFILRSGGVELNSSLPVLVESLRHELESEIIKVLFG